MQPIKDSVHDYITVDEMAADVLDTPVFQRLRHIKQLSTVRLVFPSANHTRLEHSLGVYHLASTAVTHLDIDEERATHVRAAALLHDVGHGPYGHQTEDVIYRRTGTDHDEVDWLLTDSDRPVSRVLDRHGLDPERVAAYIAGEGALGQLISGELDVDRMDYLVRDAHHTGVPYGTIDHARLARQLTLRDGKLVLAEGNIATAESMLLARSLMNATVYRHHVSRVAGTMVERASERYLDSTDTTVEQFRRMADHDLLVELVNEVPELGRRIERRELYKRAVWANIEDVPRGTGEIGYEGERQAEREISARTGVDEVFVDVPNRPALKESGANIVVDGEVRRLDEVSELVSSIHAAERDRWRLGVYCPAEHTADVGAAAEAVLGIRRSS